MNEPTAGRDIVLVVDDTPNTLHLLTETLEQAGMTVLIATNAARAIKLLEQVTPDLILMDALMPGQDGFETTREIKRNPAWAHVPIVFMTGLTESENVIKALEAGCVDYVRKPIVVGELLARVRVHLANARIAHDTQVALDATGRHLFAVDARGGFLWCTPQTEKLLTGLEPLWSKESGVLPAIIQQSALRLISSDNGATARLEHGDATIELVVIARPRPEEILIRINEIRESLDIARLKERLGLTDREAEVLVWISYGKQNRDISETLGISPRTVNKHLEQIFEKLGVETRAAAAAVAVRAMSL